MDLEAHADRKVVRLLDRRRIAGIEQHPHGHRQRLLGPRDHQHVIRVGVDPAPAGQVVADRLAQLTHSLDRGAGGPRVTGRVRQRARPCRCQQRIGQGHAVLERVPHPRDRAPWHVIAPEGLSRARGITRLGGESFLRRPGRGTGGRGPMPRHVAARSDAPLDESFGAQLLVGRQHGVAGHAEFLGQPPGRGQPAAGREPALQDPGPQRTRQLRVQRPMSVENHGMASRVNIGTIR